MAHLSHRQVYPGAVRSQLFQSQNWAQTLWPQQGRHTVQQPTGVAGRQDLLGTTPEYGTPSTQEGVPRSSEVSVVLVPELGQKIVTPTRQAYRTAANRVIGRQDLLGSTPEYGTPSTQEGIPRGSEVTVVLLPELDQDER